MRNKWPFLLTAFLATAAALNSARGEVRPNGLFCDGAVLQQGISVPVWGEARNGEKVTVKFQNQEVSAIARDGHWRVELRPLQAGGPFTLIITGDNTVTLTNVLIGEVWLSSGQSNMSFPLSRATNAAEAIAAAADPQLRFFAVPHETADQPKTALGGSWNASAPETAANFSAVAYFFGRHLRSALKVPVGLIDTSVGGTPAQAWTPLPTLKADPALENILLRYEDSVKNYHADSLPKVTNPTHKNNRPACLYNAMIAPLQPYALAGVIWYQGEANSGRAVEYQKLFPDMIESWRAGWGQGDFPFLFVQVAPYHETTPEIRESQLLTWQQVPHTAMVVTTDIGEERNIHPTQKEPVGARLALAARALAYGEKIEYSGPVFAAMKVRDHKAELSFTHTGGGLVASGGELKGFTLAGEDGVFVAAHAQIEGNKVLVSDPSVEKPIAVRYGWDKTPVVNLFNKEGLPATPFRTEIANGHPGERIERNVDFLGRGAPRWLIFICQKILLPGCCALRW